MTLIDTTQGTAPLSRRMETLELQLRREAAQAAQRRLDDQHWAEQDAKARASKDARRANHRAERSQVRARRMAWLSSHTVDLLFVPVIVVPGALAWDAMAAYGASVWGPLGFAMPLFSEGAMWAFSAAVAIRRRKDPEAPVWHLQLGVLIFALYGAALNFLHGMAPTTAHHGQVIALSMAVVSVAGVTAHQLVAAGPRRSRAARELDRFRRAAERRQAAARKASVARALVDVDVDGHADLVYEPGLYQLRRGVTGPRLVAPKGPSPARKSRPAPAPALPALDDTPAGDEGLVREPDPQPVRGERTVREEPVQDGARGDANAPAEAPEPVQEAVLAPLRFGSLREREPVRAAVLQPTFQAPVVRDEEEDDDSGGDAGCLLAGWPREAVVERIAEEIRAANDAGMLWKPEYELLRTLNTRSQSWWEKVVGEARRAALAPARADRESSRESSRSSRAPGASDPGDPGPDTPAGAGIT
jgi:hypothetical protein